MPITIFRASGNREIDSLDLKINKWLEKLEGGTKVKVHTAISESHTSGPTFVVTIHHKGPLDSN